MKKALYLLLWAVVSVVSLVVAVTILLVRLGPWLAGLLDTLLLCPAGSGFINRAGALMDRIATRGGWIRRPVPRQAPAPAPKTREDPLEDLREQVEAPGVLGLPSDGQYDALHVGLEAEALSRAVEALNRRAWKRSVPGPVSANPDAPRAPTYFWSYVTNHHVGDSGHGYYYLLWRVTSHGSYGDFRGKGRPSTARMEAKALCGRMIEMINGMEVEDR